MHLRCVLSLVLLLLGNLPSVYGQKANSKEWSNWYFGEYAGVSFLSDPPNVLQNSGMFTYECAASISDKSGNLIMYTNGSVVYDRTHKQMKNGIIGPWTNLSSSNGVIILPQPGNDSMYYIFISPALETSSHLDSFCFVYAIVNKNANGSLGEVVSKFNILINYTESLNSPCERVGFTRHGSEDAWWVISYDSAFRFVSYKLDNKGVHANPVVSQYIDHSQGYMPFTPDGSKFITGDAVYKFDNTSGRIQGILGLIPKYLYSNYFTVSPKGDKVYFDHDGQVFQFDLNETLHEKYFRLDTIANLKDFKFHAMMTAPDAKVYINTFGSQFNDPEYLSVVDFPDKKGGLCGFRPAAIKVKDTSLYNFGLGLPPIDMSIFDVPISVQSECGSISGKAKFSVQPDSFFWRKDGLGKSGKNAASVKYTIKDNSLHELQLIVFRNGVADTFSKEVSAKYKGQGKRIFAYACNGDSVKLSASVLGRYLWSNGDTTETTMVLGAEGVHWLKISSDYICERVDTFIVKDRRPDGDTIHKIKCHGERLFLETEIDGNYSWNTGSTTFYSWADTPGVYTVSIFNDTLCDYHQYFNVKESRIFKDYFLDRVICDTAIELMPDSGMWRPFIWQDSSVDFYFIAKEPGQYTATSIARCTTEVYHFNVVQDSSCLDTSRVPQPPSFQCQIYIPNAFSPNMDTLNQRFGPVISDCRFRSYQMEVFNRWGERLFLTDSPSEFWDGTYNGQKSPEGAYFYLIKLTLENGEERRLSGLLHMQGW